MTSNKHTSPSSPSQGSYPSMRVKKYVNDRKPCWGKMQYENEKEKGKK
jgi:hypothetical protein